MGAWPGRGLGQPERGAMRLGPEWGGERERARASEAWALPKVGSSPYPVLEEGRLPLLPLCGPPLIRIRPGLGVARGEGGGRVVGWSCPKLPHVALSLECGGLICSGWEVGRRLAPWVPDVALRGVSLPSSTRGLASPLRFQALCHLLLFPFPSFSSTRLSGHIFAAVFDFPLSLQ